MPVTCTLTCAVLRQHLVVDASIADGPVICDFYAHWCGPCMVLGRTLDKLAVAMGDAVDIVKVRERHCTRASAQGSLVPV